MSEKLGECFIWSSIICILIGLILFGVGIYYAVQDSKFSDNIQTECLFDSNSSEIISCTGSQACGKQTCSCQGYKGIYFYNVLDVDNSAMCNQVYYETLCLCTFDSNGVEEAKNSNGWHTCYISDCEVDGFTFNNPGNFKTSYTALFITGSILLTVSCIILLIMFDVIKCRACTKYC
eukprot:424039_1